MLRTSSRFYCYKNANTNSCLFSSYNVGGVLRIFKTGHLANHEKMLRMGCWVKITLREDLDSCYQLTIFSNKNGQNSRLDPLKCWCEVRNRIDSEVRLIRL